MDTLILKKACSFCTYQDRTQNEVRLKLAIWKIQGDEAEEIITWLILENFINEERFSKLFAGGKFRVKKWGKRKIIFELKARNISPYCIKEAINKIDDTEYQETINELIRKKMKDLTNENNKFIQKQKIATYIIGKGFESDLVWSLLSD